MTIANLIKNCKANGAEQTGANFWGRSFVFNKSNTQFYLDVIVCSETRYNEDAAQITFDDVRRGKPYRCNFGSCSEAWKYIRKRIR